MHGALAAALLSFCTESKKRNTKALVVALRELTSGILTQEQCHDLIMESADSMQLGSRQA
jgi:hypothetical protein